MTKKEIKEVLKVYGLKMVKPSYGESDETGAITFYAYSLLSGLVYYCYIDQNQAYAEMLLMSPTCRHAFDDVSYMFFG